MQKTAKNFVELLRQGARMWVGMSYVAELEHVAKVRPLKSVQMCMHTP